MLLINPTPAQIAALLPIAGNLAGAHNYPGGRLIALSTDGAAYTVATATHYGKVAATERGPVIYWMWATNKYALTYHETLKCYQVAVATDEYALPSDHTPIHAGFGALLSTVYTRSTARMNGPGPDGYTLHRLKLPHSLDGLSRMFRTDEQSRIQPASLSLLPSA